ncbi:NAD(P)H-binding protein [Evansella cellulosilytica]|uniref:NAD-dependent epimerase/dehydratase n=1 Tax=Evansella cellulosilytica (strain ATCC 21833 / DSM 2522 / FERM P-1141 / JCM 9156 / N-4) TaxID=649639 RepID=E6TY53_EVAC2|nr:NAD(P)H-binding protein [Evansella cellulosilytica]ADU32372.1 NAD-dependent epimerase/dehydratase [Evansella cellulosilytica DSM 2522]
MKKALVAGATGLIGHHLMEELLHSGLYDEVRVLSRRESGFIDETIVKERVIDFDELHKHADMFRGIDDVFVCLGTTMKKAKTRKRFMKVDFKYPLKIAELAKEKHVKRFLIVSSIGSNREATFFYSRVKGKLEEALVSLQLPSLHIFRPSLLVGKRKEFRLGEKTAEFAFKPLSIFLVGPYGKYKPIKATHLAKAMFALAQEDSSGVHLYESDRIQQLGRVLTQDHSRRRKYDSEV